MLEMSGIIIWLIILVAMVVIEVATLGLTTVWFAGGAVAAIFANLLHASTTVQIIVFIIVSGILLVFTRPLAVKYFNKDRVRTNVESLVGRQAVVVTEIDNIHESGTVTIGGIEWTARSTDSDIVIPVGAVVIIRGINGVKVIVEEEKRG